MALLLTIYLFAALPVIRHAAGDEIGQLPTEQHDVSGTLHVTDSRTLSFEDFNYDGLGPGAFLYYYVPGQAVDRNGGGVIIPLPSSVGQSDGRFQRRRYSNEDFTVTLPVGTDVCDIGTLTIWCRPFRAIFTRIVIPRNIFVNNGADPCTLQSAVTSPSPTPQPTILPPTTSTNTTSASTTTVSTSTTSGPTTSGPTTSTSTTSTSTTSGPTASTSTTSGPTTSGPTTSGSTASISTTSGPTASISTTSGPTASISITSGPTVSTSTMSTTSTTTLTTPQSDEIGQLPTEQHDVSGTLYVTDSRTLSFEDFNYDGLGPGAFLYYYAPGQAVDRNGGGVIIPLPSSVGQSDGRFQRRRYSNEDFTVTLPVGTDVCDIGTLTIWCRPFRAIFTRIVIPRNIFVNNGADPCTLQSAVTSPSPTPQPTMLPPTTSTNTTSASTTTVSTSTTSGPTTSGPTTSTSTTSTSTTSGPTASTSTTSGPTASTSTTSGPTTSGPTTSGSTASISTTSGPTASISTTSGPTASISTTSGPTASISTTSGPTVSTSTMSTTSTTTLTTPQSDEIGQLPTEQHDVSGTLYVTDSRTLSFEDFNYDGLGPGAFLYYYAPGQAVDRNGGGVIIPLPSSVGQSDGRFQRRRYSNEDFTVTLPVGTDVCDIGTLTIWCRPFRAIFTRIVIPRNIFVNNGADPCTLQSAVTSPSPTPQPTMLPPTTSTNTTSASTTTVSTSTTSGSTMSTSTTSGPTASISTTSGPTVSTSTMSTTSTTTLTTPQTTPSPVFDNCIPLHETLHLSWSVDMDNSKVRFMLCGCQSLDAGTNQYMGFGLSGSATGILMSEADPTIAWVDAVSGQPHAVDYYLSDYTQCRAGVGACPDTMDSSGTCTNDVTDVTGFVRDGQQCVAFTRPFSTTDTTCDRTMDPTNQNQYIVWAVGGLGVTAFKHFIRAEPGRDPPIHLGRTPQDQCSGSQLVCGGCQPFRNERIIARDDATFLAQIGPSGNERGYMGITGQVGWGIAWHINGTLIPELIVERGKTYTFIVEGGNNTDDLSNYHPLYITDSIGGGRLENTQQERDNETVFAGFDEEGRAVGIGPLCQLRETAASENIRQRCSALPQYIATLREVSGTLCNSGQPGPLVWVPDENTPDTVYYQCATHLNLGWRIIVLNREDPIPNTAPPPTRSLFTDTPTIDSQLTETPPSISSRIEIGQLPTEQHGVSGTLYVTDSRTLSFEDFNYDGLGPGAFLYYYAPGKQVDRNGGGVIIPLPSSVGQSDGSFQRRRYSNEDFTVTLPDGMDLCDIGTLTIWCRPFRAIFTRIEIPRNIFLNNGTDPCTLAAAQSGGAIPSVGAPLFVATLHLMAMVALYGF